MATSTLTSKGQLTVPKEIRDRLQLKTGQKIEFTVTEDGHVLIRVPNRDVTSLRGMIKTRRHSTVQQMNEAIADGYAGLPKGRK